MSVKFQPDADPGKLPTHKDSPDSDGAIVENFLEMPQSALLTDSIPTMVGETPSRPPVLHRDE